jgi:hypothetical protein
VNRDISTANTAALNMSAVIKVAVEADFAFDTFDLWRG